MCSVRAIIALVTVLSPAIAGDVAGQVIIAKRLTRKNITPTVYNLRGTAAPAPSIEIESELDRTVVWLEGGPAAPTTPQTFKIEQRNSRFEPDLLVVPAGSTVEFPNWDPIFHNVFSLSGAQPFDLGYYPQSQSRTVKFKRSGIVQVYCHIHSNMYAAIVVTSSPWYGKPAEDGSFTFHDIPAGHYRATAWHKVAGMYQVEIDVPEKGTAAARIRVPIDVEPRH